MSVFTRKPEEYKRSINPVKEYIRQAAFFASKVSGLSIEETTTDITERLGSKSLPIVDKEVVCYRREDSGDKKLESTSLLSYIKETVLSSYVLAPTFTNYVPESVRISPLVKFTARNVKNRSIAKKEAFLAKVAGDTVRATFKTNEQDGLKRYNNSLSGSFATEGSVFLNTTAHSTLTSITRTETSLANSLNEKLIEGNRHYRTPKLTLNNINFLASIANRTEIKAAVEKYSLTLPTVEDTLQCINRSTDLYWIDREASLSIELYLSRLDPYELASIVYTNDLYHIGKHNTAFMKSFIDRFIQKKHGVYEDPVATMNTFPAEVINYVHQVCMTEVRGIGKDYTKLDKEIVCTLAATAQNVLDTLEHYRDFFKAFLVTDDTPVSVAYIKDMSRRAVVLSDTDSTMFSVDNLVTAYYGKFNFTEEGYAIAGLISYIASQAIVHVLAMYSSNLGVAKDKLHVIQMKPEYVFSCFIQTPVAKHYGTAIVMQEGNVYKEPNWEFKGVHLKNSAVPKFIINGTNDKIKELIGTITSNKKISILKEIQEVVALEKTLSDNILHNKEYYYKKTTIKEADSYKLEEDMSPYWYYKLWTTVFQEKYGEIPLPPYKAYVIPLTITNKTKTLLWLASIEDRTIADKLAAHLETAGKKELPTIYLSEDYVRAYGVPPEILSIVDVKRLILTITTSRRMILDSLGVTPKEGMLISEINQSLL